MKIFVTLVTLAGILWAMSDSERIDRLEAQISVLQKQQTSITDEMQEGYDILERVETKSIVDRIDFSPELDLRFDKLHYKVGKFEPVPTPSPDGTIARNRDDFEKDFTLASSLRFRLNMTVNLMDDVSFRGRVVMQRSTQSNERLCILSHKIKSAEAKTGIDIDWAYIDYKVNRHSDLPIVLSLGILPTTGGTPMQYASQAPRESLYPALVFDINTIGLSLTMNLSHYLGTEGFVRLIGAKAYTLDPAVYPYQCNRENIDNATIYGVYFDLKPIDDMLVSLGVNMMQSLKAHPYLGPDLDASNADNLGDMLTFGFGIDAEHFIDERLTVFAHAAMSHPHPNGSTDDYGPGSSIVFTQSDYATGPMLNHNGFAVYAGLAYSITNTWQVGAEYNHGSRYWFAATQGAVDIYNKLATRGDVGEGYLLWKMHRYVSMKVGYMYTYEAYTGSGWHFGEPIDKGGHQQVGYVSFDTRF